MITQRTQTLAKAVFHACFLRWYFTLESALQASLAHAADSAFVVKPVVQLPGVPMGKTMDGPWM